MGQPNVPKICKICGQDCSTRPRIKDSAGRYYCKSCHEQAKQKRTAPPTPPPAPLAEEPGGLLAEIVDDMTPPDSANACMRCGQPMVEHAAICTNCGYNTQTGQQIVTAESKPKRQWGVNAGGFLGTIATPLGVALAALVFFGLFYVAALASEEVALVYFLVQSLFGLGIAVLVLVFAFRESIATGFLTLCIPCYVLYFVFGVCENDYVKWLFALSIVTSVAKLFLNLPPGFEDFQGLPGR